MYTHTENIPSFNLLFWRVADLLQDNIFFLQSERTNFFHITLVKHKLTKFPCKQCF